MKERVLYLAEIHEYLLPVRVACDDELDFQTFVTLRISRIGLGIYGVKTGVEVYSNGGI